MPLVLTGQKTNACESQQAEPTDFRRDLERIPQRVAFSLFGVAAVQRGRDNGIVLEIKAVLINKKRYLLL